jgi:hypothetical protein
VSKGFPKFLQKQKQAEENSDFLKRQNLASHNMNTIRLPSDYALKDQFSGSPILGKGRNVQLQQNYFTHLGSKTQTININQVKKQFINDSKEGKFSSTLLPRIGERREKTSSSADD